MAGLRVGILGGTFDPVHRGHMALAAAARDELRLGRVLFVPAGQPWRKAGRRITSDEQRLAMLRGALDGEAAFEIETLELEREGATYTVDTLEALQARWRGADMFFILGEDALADLPNWVQPDRILKLARLAVARRAGAPAGGLEKAERSLADIRERVVWLSMPLVDVTATEIRERVRQRLPIDDMVPEAVETYIREHGLYRG